MDRFMMVMVITTTRKLKIASKLPQKPVDIWAQIPYNLSIYRKQARKEPEMTAQNHYGIGYGGQGAWFNKHFPTLEQATAAFDTQVKQLQSAYPGMKTVDDESCPSTLLRQYRIVNVKRDGKPGKLRQTVQLYIITQHDCEQPH